MSIYHLITNRFGKGHCLWQHAMSKRREYIGHININMKISSAQYLQHNLINLVDSGNDYHVTFLNSLVISSMCLLTSLSTRKLCLAYSFATSHSLHIIVKIVASLSVSMSQNIQPELIYDKMPFLTNTITTYLFNKNVYNLL